MTAMSSTSPRPWSCTPSDSPTPRKFKRHHIAERDEGAGQRLRDLVFHRAAVQRVRVRDQRDAARRSLGQVEQAFHLAGVAGQVKLV
jgi:hypothetical protein